MTAEIAGRLKQRVRLERAVHAPDGAGGSHEQWRTVGEHWAEMRPVDALNLSTLVAETRVPFRRWRIMLRSSAEVALGMRLRWRDLDLRVTGIDRDPAAPDRLMVVAEEFGG
ncbi:MAG: head-tail adaptor protein [Thermaurantiacus tibetensis]|uniref:head-tail adaptor protein n=1 Tax=Thermaurantiacus tibetensis TaxID=2759035 RepID=UPI00188E7E32|nr:head-tail adaptor protein [Thermaurantiacus tibetensis]